MYTTALLSLGAEYSDTGGGTIAAPDQILHAMLGLRSFRAVQNPLARQLHVFLWRFPAVASVLRSNRSAAAATAARARGVPTVAPATNPPFGDGCIPVPMPRTGPADVFVTIVVGTAVVFVAVAVAVVTAVAVVGSDSSPALSLSASVKKRR